MLYPPYFCHVAIQGAQRARGGKEIFFLITDWYSIVVAGGFVTCPVQNIAVVSRASLLLIYVFVIDCLQWRITAYIVVCLYIKRLTKIDIRGRDMVSGHAGN